ncbi:MAG: GDP-mannose 4,6-dehydratase [Thermoanaerobaculia bacterium]
MSGTALVTGGAGFIGSHLVDRLLAAGWQVRTLDDLSTGRRENLESAAPRSALRVVDGSVLDTRLVEDLVDGVDVVFHLAATVGVDLVVREPLRTLRTNLGGTESVLAAAGHRGTPVLLASSSEVYGRTARVPQAEDDDRWLGPPGSARWSYATSKAAAECLALAWHRERGLPTVVARLFNTIGARQRGRYGMVVPRFVSAAVRGEPLRIFGDGSQTRCFCHVRDVVEGLLGLAIHAPAYGGVFNLGGGEEISIRNLALRVLGLAGVPDSETARRLRMVPDDEAGERGADDMRRRVPDTRRVEAAIGWRPRIGLDEALGELIARRRGE